MDVCNLAFNQFANQDVRTLTNGLYRAKNLLSFRMAPPAAPDGATSNCLRQIWKRTSGSLENDSVTFNKCERFLLIHHACRLWPPPHLTRTSAVTAGRGESSQQRQLFHKLSPVNAMASGLRDGLVRRIGFTNNHRYPSSSLESKLSADGLIMAESAFPHELRDTPSDNEPA
jgi:hypothetical protein